MMLRRTLAVTALLLCGSLAACADGSSSGAEATDGGETQVAGSAFPVVVEHRYGETTVPAEPQRVVSVGLTEQDTLLQLGVVPLAVTEWYGDQPFATWPWAQELLGDAEPEVLSAADGFELEKIAALEPDLIVGTNAGMSRKDYERFSDIAPTITSVEGASLYFSSWQDQTLQIGRASGQETEGQALVDDLEAGTPRSRPRTPSGPDLTATFSQGGPYDGQLYVYPAGLEHRLPHRPRLHDDRRPRGVRPRGRRPRRSSPPRTSA